MPKISVIIPVYNTEKYLRECLDSVIAQTLQDIEIIVVNHYVPNYNSTRDAGTALDACLASASFGYLLES